MFFAFLFLVSSIAGGLAITYLYDEDAPLYVRLAAGVIIGNALTGVLGFILACIIGLNPLSVGIAAALGGLPILLFRRQKFYQRLRKDFADFRREQRSLFARFNIARHSVFAAYVGLVVMLWFFFERAMLDVRDGIGTGSTHNIGDLPFHLLVINSFAAGQNFPAQNPVYAGVAFTYPYMTDLVAAMMNAVGISIRDAMFCQNFVLATALVVLLARFTFKLTNNKTAALIAPFLLLFNGGFGFLLFLRDAMASNAGIINQLFNLTLDYTIRGEGGWRWGNSLTSLFLTQRAFLLGLPLALIVLTKVWEIFTAENKQVGVAEKPDEENTKLQSSGLLAFFGAHRAAFIALFVVGLLAGMLPLIHAHTFAVVMGVSALVAAMSLRHWRLWLTFFIAAGLIAVPELLLATVGSAAKATSFIGWEFGWDNGETNPLWFWFKNTGLFIPLLTIAIGWLTFLAFRKTSDDNAQPESILLENNQNANNFFTTIFERRRAQQLLLFYAPFVLCFLIPNTVRLAPWVWDNVKVLIYWFVGSIPLVALVLAFLWQRSKADRFAVVGLLITLTFSGWLDVWRVASRQYEYQIISPAMIKVAAQLRERTKPREIILGAPDYSNLPVLTGQRWFLGWTAHVWSHGINAAERENVIKQIYAGGENADDLIQKYNIHYVIIGPLERKYTPINEAYFQNYPVVAEAGEYRVYRVD